MTETKMKTITLNGQIYRLDEAPVKLPKSISCSCQKMDGYARVEHIFSNADEARSFFENVRILQNAPGSAERYMKSECNENPSATEPDYAGWKENSFWSSSETVAEDSYVDIQTREGNFLYNVQRSWVGWRRLGLPSDIIRWRPSEKNDWRNHYGGGIPVALYRQVEVQFRDGRIIGPVNAMDLMTSKSLNGKVSDLWRLEGPKESHVVKWRPWG